MAEGWAAVRLWQLFGLGLAVLRAMGKEIDLVLYRRNVRAPLELGEVAEGDDEISAQAWQVGVRRDSPIP